MTKPRNAMLAVVLLLTMGIILPSSAYAGSVVVGSVAGSVNATVGGQAVLPNATIFSGDNLQVKDGVAVIALGRGSRTVFGRESTASFSREADSVTAVLGQGNVSLFCPDGGTGVRVKVGEVTIAPAKGFKTLGEVAVANGSITVTTKEGLLRVEGDGQAVEVAKGKTIVVMPKAAGAPQGGGGRGGHGGGRALKFLTLGAGVTAAVMAGWAIEDARDSQDSANASIAAANAANQAAQAAAAAALAAQNAAVAAGCALNQLAHQLGMETSPYTPPAGYPPC